MLVELRPTDYARVRDLFHALEHHRLTSAVLDGTRPGKVFVDDADDPRTGFLFTPQLWAYLAGEAGNESFNRAVNTLLFDGETLGDDTSALQITTDSTAWASALPDVFAPRQPAPNRRRHYVCRHLAHDWRQSLPSGYTVQRIDDALLRRSGLHIPDEVHEWLNEWGSAENYLAHGLGFVAIDDDAVVCWAMADYFNDGVLEMGVHTAPEHRRLGLGAATVAAMVEHALAGDVTAVNWLCSDDNIGSIRLAEKVGFERERDYVAYYLIFDEAAHLAQLGYGLLQAGEYQPAIDAYAQLMEVTDANPVWLQYDLARAWAGLGTTDVALAHLRTAADQGWSDTDGTERCREFADLLDTPEFGAVLNHMRRNAAATG